VAADAQRPSVRRSESAIRYPTRSAPHAPPTWSRRSPLHRASKGAGKSTHAAEIMSGLAVEAALKSPASKLEHLNKNRRAAIIPPPFGALLFPRRITYDHAEHCRAVGRRGGLQKNAPIREVRRGAVCPASVGGWNNTARGHYVLHMHQGELAQLGRSPPATRHRNAPEWGSLCCPFERAPGAPIST
jgi:hypothetical protein